MKISRLLLVALSLFSCFASAAESYHWQMTPFTVGKVQQIIQTNVLSNPSMAHGAQVAAISAAFLGTPYRAKTLIGSPVTPEVLVANFDAVDCFTLVDYIEALSRAHDSHSFLNNLANIRYIDGHVDYASRKHFFTDWVATTPRNAIDVTRSISPNTISVEKELNRKDDGGAFLPEIGFFFRKIDYIPGRNINDGVLNNLKTGDYVGVYSPVAGLDVSHVGIVIKNSGGVWFRNASMLPQNMRVVDLPFKKYMINKPGIIVLRTE
jgi:hypothetical protein